MEIPILLTSRCPSSLMLLIWLHTEIVPTPLPYFSMELLCEWMALFVVDVLGLDDDDE